MDLTGWSESFTVLALLIVITAASCAVAFMPNHHEHPQWRSHTRGPGAYPDEETRMARRKSNEYRREAVAEVFELELESPDGSEPRVIVFGNPQELDSETAFDLAVDTDPKHALQVMLSDEDWRAFWDEWRSRPVGQVNDLLADVMEHYGAQVGKRGSSRR